RQMYTTRRYVIVHPSNVGVNTFRQAHTTQIRHGYAQPAIIAPVDHPQDRIFGRSRHDPEQGHPFKFNEAPQFLLEGFGGGLWSELSVQLAAHSTNVIGAIAVGMFNPHGCKEVARRYRREKLA